MKTVKVGIIGSGFIASIHIEALRKVYGIHVEIIACASPNHARDFAVKHQIPYAYFDYRELLQNPEIDVVDICTPNFLHKSMILDAAAARKHIISEKPLTGFFGRPGDQLPIGEKVDRQTMLETVQDDLQEIRQAINTSGMTFMYAENWIYAPSLLKAKQMIKTTGGIVLSQRAEESHSGSHAAYAREWRFAGGGSLLRLGAHPIASVIHIKHFEGLCKNQPIRVKSISGEVAQFSSTTSLSQKLSPWLANNWVDVEDWSAVTLTFSDETKALVVASDTILGGIRNQHDIFTSHGAIQCNMNPSNSLMFYTPDAELLKDVYVAEKVETKAGWQYVAPDEDWIRGYQHEMQDFMECIAYEKQPASGLDLACETVETVYGGYLAAATGQKVVFG